VSYKRPQRKRNSLTFTSPECCLTCLRSKLVLVNNFVTSVLIPLSSENLNNVAQPFKPINEHHLLIAGFALFLPIIIMTDLTNTVIADAEWASICPVL